MYDDVQLLVAMYSYINVSPCQASYVGYSYLYVVTITFVLYPLGIQLTSCMFVVLAVSSTNQLHACSSGIY